MRVYRHQYSGGRKSRKWYVEYRDYANVKRRVPGYVDKRATEQLGAELERKAARIRAGLDEPDRDDKSAIHELIDEWHAAMVGRGLGATHADQYKRVCSLIVSGCGFLRLKDLNGNRAQQFLEKQAFSNRTYQWHRSALSAFGNWLAKKRKLIPSNPFTSIDSRNPEEDPRRARRALSAAEFKRFLAAARKGRRKFKLTGPQRYHLYLVAAYTGLRLSACIALTPAHFDLTSKVPSVHSEIRLQKNRKAHTVPLPVSVAARLRTWFKGKAPDELLWPGKFASNRDGAKMVRFDLAAAEIPFRTPEGQFDFHALRHQYATALVRSGASQVEVQQLLDHVNPAMSARYFRHLKTEELAKPVGRLPKV